MPIRTRWLSASMILVTALPAVAVVREVPADYATIQAAVDAASSGDTIHIAPGIYLGQISITNKNLTLAGVPGAVVRAQAGMLPNTPDHCTVGLLGVVRAEVVIKGLTFEGEHLCGEYPCSLTGILFDQASGRLEDCLIMGFQEAAGEGLFSGFGFTADNNTSLAGAALHVEVRRCFFADNALSISVRGSDADQSRLHLTFTIEDNSIEGIGRVAGNQAGIMISYGASGDVRRNRISGHYNTAGQSGEAYSIGIYAVDWLVLSGARTSPISLLPVRYEGNDFVSNQLHLASVLAHGSQFLNNTFQGAGGLDARLGALAITGNTNQIIGNRFSDLPAGITLVGNDPVFGTLFGIATNSVVTGNRFCDVTAPIVEQLLVTGTTIEGTQLCETADHALAIAPAVILTWPDFTDGWILEACATVNGPWASADATPSLRDGQNMVAVKTDREHRFFRLRKP